MEPSEVKAYFDALETDSYPAPDGWHGYEPHAPPQQPPHAITASQQAAALRALLLGEATAEQAARAVAGDVEERITHAGVVDAMRAAAAAVVAVALDLPAAQPLLAPPLLRALAGLPPVPSPGEPVEHPGVAYDPVEWAAVVAPAVCAAVADRVSALEDVDPSARAVYSWVAALQGADDAGSYAGLLKQCLPRVHRILDGSARLDDIAPQAIKAIAQLFASLPSSVTALRLCHEQEASGRESGSAWLSLEGYRGWAQTFEKIDRPGLFDEETRELARLSIAHMGAALGEVCRGF